MWTHHPEEVVSAVARTDVGLRRANNEDAFLIADLGGGKRDLRRDALPRALSADGILLAVADGMGGAAAGEVASCLAMEALRDALNKLPARFGCATRLKRAAEVANERVWDAAQRRPERRGMGTTLTAALLQGGQVCIAQVGDSRAYLLRDRQVTQLTKDQSLVQHLLDAGALNAEEAERFPQRNVILQALGREPTVRVEVSNFALRRGDHLLLCSDGLSNKLNGLDIRFAVEHTATLEDACRLLIEWANARGGEDNITVVIARYDGEALPHAHNGERDEAIAA
jgi:PPM family protein phosphatase